MERDYNLEKRKYVIGASVIVIVLIYLIRLFTLQIMSEDYKKNADSNAFLNKTQYPSRGVMYDRNGNLLVYNQPAYDVTMVMKEVHNLDTLDLCKTLNITPDYFKKRIREIKDRRSNPGYSPYTHQVFMTQLSAEECGVFQEKLFKFPGFYIQRRTIRQYNYNAAAATVLAFMREPVLRLVTLRDSVEDFEPGIKSMGFSPFFRYILLCTFLFCTILLVIDTFSFFNLPVLLLKILTDASITIICILCAEAIRRKK